MVANAAAHLSQAYVTIREARSHREYDENRAFVEIFGTLPRSMPT